MKLIERSSHCSRYFMLPAWGEEEAVARPAAAWRDFDAFRMERLVGCLPRVPKPDGRN